MSAPAQQEAWHPRGKLSHGGTHYVLTAPSGSTKGLVVMIHGLGTWSYNYDGMADLLSSQGYTALQLDNLGMGHSRNAPEDIDDPYSPKHQHIFNGTGHVQIIHDLLTELGLLSEPYIVVGHSMGGAIATLYAEKYPSEMRAVVLLSPSGVQEAWAGKAAAIALIRAVVPSCLLPLILRKLTNDVKNIDNIRNFGDFKDKDSAASRASCRAIYDQHQHNSHAIKCFFNCVRFFPFFSLHTSVSAVAMNGTPVLLLHGESDETVPPSPTVAIWSRALDGHKASPLAEGGARSGGSASRVQLLAGGHMFFLEDPAATLDILLEWLRGL